MSHHGSPKDRGSADAYYCRPAQPHKKDHSVKPVKKIYNLTQQEIDEYMDGYNNEEARFEP